MADQSVQLKAGLYNVGSYQVSGIPFLTGALTIPSSSATPLEITFPSVTRTIHIHNNDTNAGRGVKIGFSANGVKSSNYWLVEPHTTNGKNNDYISLDIKCTKIYLIGQDSSNNTTNVFIAAELTGITGYDLATAYSGSTGIG